jgi:hypothetical protein
MIEPLEKMVERYRLAMKQPPPPGQIPVHNNIRTTPQTRQGARGFRAWWAQPGAEFVLCDCGWRPDLGAHCRIERPFDKAEPAA